MYPLRYIKIDIIIIIITQSRMVCSCHVWLTNLAYCMDSVDELHVRNHHGKLEAMLTAKVEPCDIKGK